MIIRRNILKLVLFTLVFFINSARPAKSSDFVIKINDKQNIVAENPFLNIYLPANKGEENEDSNEYTDGSGTALTSFYSESFSIQAEFYSASNITPDYQTLISYFYLDIPPPYIS